ncbi:MAG: hypothetical protein ACM3X5_06010 [Bacillota bacterium]
MSEILFGRDDTVRRLFADPWIARLNAADTVALTIRVANDFLGEGLSAADRAALPIAVPTVLANAHDVTECTFAITQAQLTLRKKTSAQDALLDRIAMFFSYASARMAYLREHVAHA